MSTSESTATSARVGGSCSRSAVLNASLRLAAIETPLFTTKGSKWTVCPSSSAMENDSVDAAIRMVIFCRLFIVCCMGHLLSLLLAVFLSHDSSYTNYSQRRHQQHQQQIVPSLIVLHNSLQNYKESP